MYNSLLKRMISADSKTCYDASCKSVLASKSILAHILKATVRECQDLDVTYIRDFCIEKDIGVSAVPIHPHEGGFIHGLTHESSIPYEGVCYFDIHFSAVFPQNKKVYFDLEAQNQNPPYPVEKRGYYYLGRMISAQYETEFKGSHYELLKKVYSIWICINPSKEKQNTIVRYEEKAEFLKGYYEIKEDYDVVCTIVINLGKKGDKGNEGILKLLEVVLSNSRSIEEKVEIIEKEFHIELTEEEREEMQNMCNLGDAIEARGIEIGFERGIILGQKEGENQGKISAKLESIRNLQSSLNITIEEAMNLLKIPVNEQKNYLDKMQ